MAEAKDLQHPRVTRGHRHWRRHPIYLGRAQRDTLVIDAGHSWQNGSRRWRIISVPESIVGEEPLKRGDRQARHYAIQFARDEIVSVKSKDGFFVFVREKR